MGLSGEAKALTLLLYIIMIGAGVWMEVGEGAVYKVGDSDGWTTIGNIDYEKWASSNVFHVGDSILFEYNPKYHNLMEVNRADFRSCNAASPMKTYTTGNDSFTIKAPGHYYFLCGFPGHCETGQKVDIRVLKSYLPTTVQGSSPIPSPSPSPASSVAAVMTPGPAPNSAVARYSMWLLTTTVGFSVICLAVCFSGFA